MLIPGAEVADRALWVPEAGPVHLWWASTGLPPGGLGALRSEVDDETADRAGRMVQVSDGIRVLAAHALLRRVAGSIMGVAPRRVRIRRQCARCGSREHGRPYLVTPSGRAGPDISLSYSAGLAVVAVASGALRVGVDVENPRTGHDWQQTCRSVMSASEQARSRWSPDPDEAYLRAWTGKEAVVKATGLGLSADLTTIDVLGATGLTDGWWRIPRQRALVSFLTLVPPAVHPDRRPYTSALAVIEPCADPAVPGQAKTVPWPAKGDL